MDIRYLLLLSVVVVNFKVKKIPDFMRQVDRKKKKSKKKKKFPKSKNFHLAEKIFQPHERPFTS